MKCGKLDIKPETFGIEPLWGIQERGYSFYFYDASISDDNLRRYQW